MLTNFKPIYETDKIYMKIIKGFNLYFILLLRHELTQLITLTFPWFRTNSCCYKNLKMKS